MPDASELVRIIKQAAVDAVNASQPIRVEYGTVLSVSPLSVRLDQQRTLDADFLRRLDFSGTVDISGENVTVYEFVTGDVVALLRVQGGQEYLILGKAVR